MNPREYYHLKTARIRKCEMDNRKFCSYCQRSDMDLSRFPPRYTCTLYKERIKKDEQARTCPDYKPLEKVEKR